MFVTYKKALLLINLILGLGVVLGSAGIFLVLGHAFENESGHTGLDMYLMFIPPYLVFFLVTLILSFVQYSKKHSIDRISIAAFGVSLYGILLAFVLEHSRVLVEYHRWIRSGMSEVIPWYRLPLLCVLGLIPLLFLVWLCLGAVRERFRA